jgi:cytochrome P450
VGAYNELLEPTLEKAIYFAANIIGPQDLIQKLPWSQNKVLRKTTGNLRRFCLALVRDRRANFKAHGEFSNDILSLLISSNNFSDEELVDQMLTFLAAG